MDRRIGAAPSSRGFDLTAACARGHSSAASRAASVSSRVEQEAAWWLAALAKTSQAYTWV